MKSIFFFFLFSATSVFGQIDSSKYFLQHWGNGLVDTIQLKTKFQRDTVFGIIDWVRDWDIPTTSRAVGYRVTAKLYEDAGGVFWLIDEESKYYFRGWEISKEDILNFWPKPNK